MRIELYTKIDLLDPNLSITDVLIYKIICKDCERRFKNESSLSSSEIASELNLTFPTVKSSLTTLIENNYISISNINKNKRTITLCQQRFNLCQQRFKRL